MLQSMNSMYEAIIGGCIMVIGFFAAKKINDNDAAIQKTAGELAAHKLHVADTYEKAETTQASLARVHDRIDEGNAATEHRLDIISNDIKTLLSKR